MDFLGDLFDVKLFDLIKPLLMDRKTGLLTVKGKEQGEIFLYRGNIVHAKAGHFPGEYGFFSIMGWSTGKVAFEPDVSPSEHTIFLPAEQLFLNWSYLKNDWERIREVIPSPNTIFRLPTQSISEDKSIKKDQWNVLALSNGVRTTSEIAKILNWDESKVLKTTYQLFKAGLLEKVEAKEALIKKRLGEKFFQILEIELKRVMGPVAPFIIEDQLIDFGETKDSFPQDQTPSLIKALGEDIPNEQKRKEFKKVMMELLSVEV
mgnify:CR=1 FL=1